MTEIISTYFEQVSDETIRFIRNQKNLISTTFTIISGFVFAFGCAYPLLAIHLIWKVLSWQNGFIMWFADFLFAKYFIYPLISKQLEKDMKTPMFYGVKLEKIASYIIANRTFKRDEVTRKFEVSRPTAQEMIDKLDEVGIFVRGDNNLRVLDRNILTKEDIINRLLSSPLEGVEEEKNENEELAYGMDANEMTDDRQDDGEQETSELGWTCKPLANS